MQLDVYRLAGSWQTFVHSGQIKSLDNQLTSSLFRNLQQTCYHQVERFGIANTEYRYIGIKIPVNTGISSAFGVFLGKQIAYQ